MADFDPMSDYVTIVLQGPVGPKGDAGGMPLGGTVNEVLVKVSSLDNDTEWSSELTLTGLTLTGDMVQDSVSIRYIGDPLVDGCYKEYLDGAGVLCWDKLVGGIWRRCTAIDYIPEEEQ